MSIEPLHTSQVLSIQAAELKQPEKIQEQPPLLSEVPKAVSAQDVAVKKKASQKLARYLRALPDRIDSYNSNSEASPADKWVKTVADRKVMSDGSEIAIKVVMPEDLQRAAIKGSAPARTKMLGEEKSLMEYQLTEFSLSAVNSKAKSVDDNIGDLVTELDKEHWQAIEDVKNNYLEIFLQATTVMNNFYKDFIDIKSTLGSLIEEGGGEGKVKFNSEAFRQKIAELLEKYQGSNGKLFPEKGTATEQQAKDWLKKMGLSESSCLKHDENGNYWIQMDIEPLKVMEKDLAELGPGGEISMAKYNAWVTGFDSQAESLQTSVQMMTQKMTNANSIYDQIIKILSAFIQQNAEVRKSYL